MPRVEEGDPAPDFELADQEGRPVRMSRLRGAPVVLYFYPRDFTTVCTAEACTFRNEHDEFRGLDAHVLGVSADDVATHHRFAQRHRLPFRLLSDPDNAVRSQYGAKEILGLGPGRVTFVVDSQGTVRRRITGRLRARKHVQEALQALRVMATSTDPATPP